MLLAAAGGVGEPGDRVGAGARDERFGQRQIAVADALEVVELGVAGHDRGQLLLAVEPGVLATPDEPGDDEVLERRRLAVERIALLAARLDGDLTLGQERQPLRAAEREPATQEQLLPEQRRVPGGDGELRRRCHRPRRRGQAADGEAAVAERQDVVVGGRATGDEAPGVEAARRAVAAEPKRRGERDVGATIVEREAGLGLEAAIGGGRERVALDADALQELVEVKMGGGTRFERADREVVRRSRGGQSVTRSEREQQDEVASFHAP